MKFIMYIRTEFGFRFCFFITALKTNKGTFKITLIFTIVSLFISFNIKNYFKERLFAEQ